MPSNEADGAERRVAAIGADRSARRSTSTRCCASAADVPPLAPPGDAVARHLSAGRRPDLRIGVAQDRGVRLLLRRRPRRAARRRRGAGAASTRLNDARLPASTGCSSAAAFPRCSRGRTRGERRAAHADPRRDRRRPARLRRVRRPHVPRPLADVGGRRYRMVGAIPGDVVMHERPVGRGYVELERHRDFPWPARGGAAGAAARARVPLFEPREPAAGHALCVHRQARPRGRRPARRHRRPQNVLASYTHLRSAGSNDWAARFVAMSARPRTARATAATPALQPGLAAPRRSGETDPPIPRADTGRRASRERGQVVDNLPEDAAGAGRRRTIRTPLPRRPSR